MLSEGETLKDAAIAAKSDLSDANLSGANLSDADLSDADLSDADLSDANLRGVMEDLFAVLCAAKNEVPALLLALNEGRVDGSTYEGECACLVGTIAVSRGVAYDSMDSITPDGSRPIERLFLAIRKGDTPATNPVSAIVCGWIAEFQAAQAAEV